jgi:3-hydroxyisobutyrate dehydrogenase-like beta-hydroxyacid dehydrogenase
MACARSVVRRPAARAVGKHCVSRQHRSLEAVESVVLGRNGVVASLATGALHISSSTISVDLSERLAEEHSKASQRFVAAPVFGRPDAALAARLFVIAAGEPVALEVAMPLLKAVGQKCFVVSETPKAANLVKLSGNFPQRFRDGIAWRGFGAD